MSITIDLKKRFCVAVEKCRRKWIKIKVAWIYRDNNIGKKTCAARLSKYSHIDIELGRKRVAECEQENKYKQRRARAKNAKGGTRASDTASAGCISAQSSYKRRTSSAGFCSRLYIRGCLYILISMSAHTRIHILHTATSRLPVWERKLMVVTRLSLSLSLPLSLESRLFEPMEGEKEKESAWRAESARWTRR